MNVSEFIYKLYFNLIFAHIRDTWTLTKLRNQICNTKNKKLHCATLVLVFDITTLRNNYSCAKNLILLDVQTAITCNFGIK